MKAIEMFAGIGGFRVALDRLGIETIWANDVDQKACLVYRSHFGANSITCADIRDAKSSIPRHQLLTAGFPCQPFSAAGKKMGIHDRVRGTLFAEIVEILERLQPDFFVLENVKRLLTMDDGKHFRTILGALAGAGYFVEWRLLNARNFGLAQNRERVFIVGRKASGLLLSCDISDFSSRHSVLLLNGELTARYSLFSTTTISDLLEPVQERRKFGFAGFAFHDKAHSFDPGILSDQEPPKRLMDVLQEEAELCFDFTDITNGWIKNNTEVNSFIHGVEILSNQEGGRRMGYTIFGTRGLAPTLTAATSRHYERYRIGDRYRRLTNVEYARLQGFSDDWCKTATIYDQYILYGNAVPPPMVQWVATRLLDRCKQLPNGRRNGGHQTAAASACAGEP